MIASYSEWYRMIANESDSLQNCCCLTKFVACFVTQNILVRILGIRVCFLIFGASGACGWLGGRVLIRECWFPFPAHNLHSGGASFRSVFSNWANAPNPKSDVCRPRPTNELWHQHTPFYSHSFFSFSVCVCYCNGQLVIPCRFHSTFTVIVFHFHLHYSVFIVTVLFRFY